MGDTFISICCFQRLFFPLPYNNIFLFFSLLLWCRGRSMSMRRMVDRGEIVAVAGARDAGGVNTTTIIEEIMWELPLQVLHAIMSCQQ
jgi:hypothetical protein